MPCDGINADGTTIEYGDAADVASSTTWTEIIRTDSLTPPNETVNVVETPPPLDDANDDTVCRSPGTVTPGDVQLAARWEKTRYNTVKLLRGVERGWRVTYPDGSTETFDGFITACNVPQLSSGTRMTYDVTIAQKNSPTFTAAA